MVSPGLMQWKLFRGGSYHLLNTQNYSGIHFFNSSSSAFLIKDEKVYSFGFGHICCMSATSPRSGFVNVYEPLLIKDLSNNGVKALSTGVFHAVLLDNDGHVYCWGSNNCGQLGAGHCEETKKPFRTSLKDIVQISCGDNFTLALNKHNELWIWGTLSFTDGEHCIHKSPVFIEVPGFPTINLISAGSNHAALLTEGGKVFTWGRNINGQLGLGHRNIVKNPLQLPLVKCKYVICGANITAFVTEEGRFYYVNVKTNSVVKSLTETSLACKKIVSIAAHRKDNLIVVIDENGHTFKTSQANDKIVLIRTSQDIVGEFVDIGTPSILPFPNNPGIMQLNNNNNNNNPPARSITNQTCVGHIDVTELYNCKNFSDIEIKLSDGVLYAHKLILAAKSVKFRQAVAGNTNLLLLDMSNVNASAYRSYIQFIYTGTLQPLTIEDIPEVYFLGDQDKNEILKTKCLELWKNILKKENIVSAFNTAYEQQLEVLMQACGPILHQYLQSILASEQYNCLSNEVKLSLLTIASLRCSLQCKK